MMRFLLGAAGVAGIVTARRTTRNWGATKAECRTVLPGDEQVCDPAVVVTRAVTIDAPAEAVWPWIVQMGQDRGGMYSYQTLENLLGLDIHNADRIHQEWQDVHVGDEVWLVRRGWFGMPDGLPLVVSLIAPGRSFVLFEPPWHAVWSFHLQPRGPGRCRLISRSRSPRPHGAARVAAAVFDPITFVMTRRMLLGIRDRAERSRSTQQPQNAAFEGVQT